MKTLNVIVFAACTYDNNDNIEGFGYTAVFTPLVPNTHC